MVNETNRELRKARREPQILCIDDAPASALAATGRGWGPSGGAPEEAAWDPEVVSALARLSDRLRAAVLLDAELEPGQRSVAEIARILGISRVAAAMRLARAYTQLRELLPADIRSCAGPSGGTRKAWKEVQPHEALSGT